MHTTAHRWFGVGQSSAPDSAKAGAEAAVAATGGRTPKVVFIFSAPTHDLPVLLDAVRKEAGPQARIVGTTTSGELGSSGMTVDGASVAAIGGDGFTVRTRMAKVKEHGPRATGALAAEALQGMHDEHRVLIMLGDGLTGSPHEIVRGAYSVVGPLVPLVGGFGVDDLRFETAHQFYEDRVVSGAVVGVALGSDAPIGVGIGHGWHRIEPPMVVTKSQGAHIYQLDHEPALDVLLRRHGFSGAAGEFFDGGGQLRPLGLSRRNGEDIRAVHVGDDRTVWATADVPQGAHVWLMEADRQALINGAAKSCGDAVSRLDGLPPLGALTFDCTGRQAGLAEQGVEQEVAAIRAALQDAPFAGF